jgi:CRP-like cAMP-binding protein
MEPSKLSQLMSAINDALDNQDHLYALRIILANFQRLDDNVILRERTALILAQSGRKREAVEIYQAVARHFANIGHPMRAIAAARQMITLNPDTSVVLDHIATLYNIRSPFTSPEVKRAPEPAALSPLDLNGRSCTTPDDDLLEQAAELAASRKGYLNQPGGLPSIPLLSLLPQESLRRVLDLIEYNVYDRTQRIVEATTSPHDLVWTVSDELIAKGSNRVVYLRPNSLVGIGSFGTSACPSEVDVFAQTGSEVLRLTETAIRTLSQEFADFQNRIATLRRHSMTERILVRHPMFDGLDDHDRVKIMDTFVGLRLKKGDRLIEQSTPSPGLFIILDGKVDVVRRDEDWEITLATLKSGDIFGEIGLVADTPAVAGCVVSEDGHVIHLPRLDFEELGRRFPSVARYTASIAAERIQDNSQALSAADLAEVE